MRLFTASLATESNSFSPVPTNRASYEAAFYFPPGQHPDHAPRHTTAPLFVGRRRARQEGFELVEGSCFWAEPSAPTVQADYEAMRDEILGARLELLRGAGHVPQYDRPRQFNAALLRFLAGEPVGS